MADLEVVPIPWDQFRKEWFPAHVEPGDHVSFVAPTKSGKTTFWAGILPERNWVLAFDPKGGDTTLKKTGFQRCTTWPLDRRTMRRIREDGEPYRAILGRVTGSVDDIAWNADFFKRVLDDVFAIGGWTVYLDELQLACDRRMMDLSAQVERHLIAARDKKSSFFSSFQRPANVPRTASDQTMWIAAGRTRDRDTVNRLAEMAGRPAAEMRGLMNKMDRFSVALFSLDPYEPVILTKPHKI